MDLALNNLKRVDIPLNKETKETNQNSLINFQMPFSMSDISIFEEKTSNNEIFSCFYSCSWNLRSFEWELVIR